MEYPLLTFSLAALCGLLVVALVSQLRGRKSLDGAAAPATPDAPPDATPAPAPAPAEGAEAAVATAAREACPVCKDLLPMGGHSCFYEVCCGRVVCRKCSAGRSEARVCALCGSPATKDLDEYVARLETLVEAGDARAQCVAGMYYAEKDPKRAAALLRLAADAGLADAMGHLGLCYLQGTGVDQDAREAVRLWEAAVDQGDANAQSSLAYLLFVGEIVPKDVNRAAKLWEAAANQEEATAMYFYGTCLANGAGAKRDLPTAAKWLKLACKSGSADAKVAYAEVLRALQDGGSKKPEARTTHLA